MSEQVQVQPKRSGTEVLESIEGLLTQVIESKQRAPRKRESAELGELMKALGASQKKFSDIQKSGMIGGRNIPYAKINDLVDASRGALLANNLVVSTYTTNEGNGYSSLVTKLHHYPSGQFIESELPLLNIAEEQKRGSSITYAWRYTYAPLIGLVDNSCDDDGDSAKTYTQNSNFKRS